MAEMTSRENTSKPLFPYQYSIPVPPQAYEGHDYFCRFTPRIHRNSSCADDGSWQCQKDFFHSNEAARANAQKHKTHSSRAVGCINPRAGNFAALCVPEAIPERLVLASYSFEYGFIHDDGGSWPSCCRFRLTAQVLNLSERVVIECAKDKSETKVDILFWSSL